MDFIYASVTLPEPAFWSLVAGIPASVGGGWAVQRRKPQTNGNGIKADVKVLQSEMKGICRRLDAVEKNQQNMSADLSYIRGKLDKG